MCLDTARIVSRFSSELSGFVFRTPKAPNSVHSLIFDSKNDAIVTSERGASDDGHGWNINWLVPQANSWDGNQVLKHRFGFHLHRRVREIALNLPTFACGISQ